MSITVECPHCETRFHKLQPELRGKQMLCPVCRETFVVREVPPGEEDDVLLAEPVEESGPPPTGKGRSRADAPEPAYRSGNVGDLLPILDVEVVPDDPAPPRKGGPREVVWSEGQPPPKEVVWGEAEPGGRRAAPEAAVAEQEADDEYLYMRRRRKRRRMVLVVWGLIAVVVGIGSYGVYVLIQDWLRKEQHLAKEAQDLYAEGNYGAARERFATLLADFPDSNHKRLYDFFHDLSDVRALVYSVAVRSDPGPSVGALTAFLEKWRDDAFLKPDGYAVDVWNTTRKLGEEVVGHAEDRAKEAGSELAASQDGSRDEAITGLLDRAERWVGEAKKLAPLVERFRPENAPAGNLAAEADRVAALAGTSRANLHALQQVEKLAEDPTEANVAEIDSIVSTFDIGSHPRVRQVRDRLTVVRGKRVGFDPDPAAPVPLRDDGPPGLRFAPLLERGKPSGDPPDELGGTSVFFALARGVLYALDEADGSVRWTARVGIDTTSLPLRVPASDQNPEVVLVASNDGRRFGLTARLAESGAVLWHQPLAAPCVGSPVRVGQRVYAATADAEGTIYEIEISGGHRLGRVVT
ncbi:MAG TPA: PQQ-binding-like beta-propeller repeat protein, partial [Gemmataceae bacterium]